MIWCEHAYNITIYKANEYVLWVSDFSFSSDKNA